MSPRRRLKSTRRGGKTTLLPRCTASWIVCGRSFPLKNTSRSPSSHQSKLHLSPWKPASNVRRRARYAPADDVNRTPSRKDFLVHLDAVLAAITQVMVHHPENVDRLQQIIFF